MNITDALYRAAHNYPHGGIDALATRMGISPSSLAHKVKPSNAGAHCSPGEMAQICELTGDHGALHALAGRLGYVLLPVPQLVEGADSGFTQELVSTVREFGELITEVSSDLEDGRVTDTELRRIEGQAAGALSAIQKLVQLADRINQQGKPASERRGNLWAA